MDVTQIVILLFIFALIIGFSVGFALISTNNNFQYIEEINQFTHLYRNKRTNQMFYANEKYDIFNNDEKNFTEIIEEDGTPLFFDEWQKQSIINHK